ncbi:MAG: lipopolysaccharide heptosyltransferase II [Deltaproteobacteria bacterium]|jgi:heptosyltransferase-2|nr:lipopolysaccharide heptosyltransferase II [Deltaproteobacteria bacterium]
MTDFSPRLNLFRPLVIRGLNWLGDAVMSFPAISAIKAQNPSRRLVLAARASTAGAYESLDLFSEILVEGRELSSRLEVAKKIRALEPAGVLILPNSFSTALMARLTGAPVRVGSAKNLRSFLLTQAVTFTPQEEAAHECFKFLRLVQELGLKAPFTRPKIAPPELPESLTLPEGLRLAIAPGAAYGSAKRWPAERFAKAARLILGDRHGAAIILGGPSETQAAKEVEDDLAGGPEVLNLAGKTSLQEAAGVLGRCHLTLSNDSGLMHLSGALDVPVVAVFGPTNPIKTSPLSGRCAVLRQPAPCSPCRYRDCPKPNRLCFEGLGANEVARAATELLRPVRKSRKTVVWSPTGDLIWPTNPVLGMNFYASATEIAKAGGKPATAPYWLKVIWSPLETANDWLGLIHSRKLDPAAIFWVGDSERPIVLSQALGGRSVLITTGRAQKIIPDLLAAGQVPTIAAPDWTRALEWIESF